MKSYIFLVLTSILTSITSAQVTTERLQTSAQMAKDLAFPGEIADLKSTKVPTMAVYKPEGSGPFPAVVIVPQCHGLRQSKFKWQNLSILSWARYAVERGYVAMVLDNFQQRGTEWVCDGPTNGLNFFRGVQDTFQAADHLRSLSYVDKTKVMLVGFSWGGSVAILASSNQWASAYAKDGRFSATAALYPRCAPATPPNETPFEIINSDIQTPTLVLAGEKDIDQPASECSSRIQPLISHGQPIEFQIYPSATHCWDCESLDGFRSKNKEGIDHAIAYNKGQAQVSMKATFDFFEKSGPH